MLVPTEEATLNFATTMASSDLAVEKLRQSMPLQQVWSGSRAARVWHLGRCGRRRLANRP